MAMYSKQQLVQFVVVATLFGAIESLQKPNCSTRCGSVDIPFPFGMSEECSLDTSFFLTCNRTSSSSYAPYLNTNIDDYRVRVLNISLNGELHLSLPVASDCYNNRSSKFVNGSYWEYDLSPFHLSPMRNKLTVVGVDTAGFMVPITSESERNSYTASVCLTLYDLNLLKNGTCSGIGCCETPIPQGLSHFYYSSSTNIINNTVNTNNDTLLGTYQCGYTFLAKDGAYSFSSTDLLNLTTDSMFPVVLDWAVGNHTCQDAEKDHSNYACKSDNVKCQNSKLGPGYLCTCSPGFRGNPYLPHPRGCQDVNECMERNDCDHKATCNNFPGGYNCSCPKGYEGNGKKSGTGCKAKSKNDFTRNTILIITLSVSVGMLALVGGSSYVYWALKKRKLIKLKEQFFQQNGGILLQQQIASHRGSTETIKVFTVEELKKATNNFDKDRVLGQGGQGTVYKGVLLDNRTVAIKRSKISDPKQVGQFINEMIVLSQINHRNVVKLLGCCLETQVPMLVYEFISNSTLYEHIHGQSCSVKLTWKTRLRIAREVSGALAYLHSAASEPIIHRDVKTSNILLDQNLTAKVSDFGASRIVPLDQAQLTTLVQGTLGYLDPEYLHTSQLTEKSDVYSFGVVLAELLTGKKALSFHKQAESVMNLVVYFTSSMKEGRLLDILDNHIKDEPNVEQLMEFSNIITRCLNVKGEDRPSMKEVEMELEGLKFAEMHKQEGVNLPSEETENSLKVRPYVLNVENDIGGSSGINSSSDISNQISLSLASGR